MERVKQFECHDWHAGFDDATRNQAVEALESGQVLFFPELSFHVHDHERYLLTDKIAKSGCKNVQYDSFRQKVAGTSTCGKQQQDLLRFMHRFATLSQQFVHNLIPAYTTHLVQARTSFRPVEVKDRPSSYRKDDARLHVDAFPSTPMAGKRILRIFSNVNPEGVKRHWRLGEAFSNVAWRFLPQIPASKKLNAQFMKIFRITRGYRTPYDHYMLNLHHTMKADNDYQRNVDQEDVRFPTGATWMVFTDQASHAAMSGQFLFEQSFYLPVEGMVNPSTSPLKVLENALGRALL